MIWVEQMTLLPGTWRIDRMMRTGLLVTLVGAYAATSIGIAQPPAPSIFTARVAPVLQAKCISCHAGKSPAGNLDLTKATGLKLHGQRGDIVVPGAPERSVLYQRIAAHTMPPTGSLSVEQIDAVKQWITAGARWDGSASLVTQAKPSTKRAGIDWWSLQKLSRPKPPDTELSDPWVGTTVDAFILAELRKSGFRPAPPADRATLIRRATFDLTGLPPTPTETDEFLADRRSDAYSRLIDRLLASPAYGERWGRHWLDVARFGESNGFERDALRPNAWPYRDYVVRAFNTDKPYLTFIKEQIAGDLLESTDASTAKDAIAATGFLIGGPWDEVGVSQVNATARLRVREEELEEMIGTVSQSFLGLTANCARCHDHKFDPISQLDYYRFKAALEGVHPGDRPAISAPMQAQINASNAALKQTQARLDTLEQSVRLRIVASQGNATGRIPGPSPTARWTFETDVREQRSGLDSDLFNGAHVERGRLILAEEGAYLRSKPVPFDLKEKTLEAWVVLPDRMQRGGAVISLQSPDGSRFDAVVYGEREPGKWIAGSEGYNRTLDLQAPQEASVPSELIHVAAVYGTDNTIRLYRNGKPYGQMYTPSPTSAAEKQLQTFSAGTYEVLIGLRHRGAGSGFLRGEVEEASIYSRALTPREVQQSFQAGPDTVTETQLLQAMNGSERAERATLLARIKADGIAARTASIRSICYAVTPAQPEPTHLLKRGDVLSPGEVVSPGAISCVVGPASQWDLTPTASEGQRRLRLANWLADPNNPLTYRVMVNRIWHYHFGRGIVASPNDFGFNGEPPSNPALLDWLATEFKRNDGSIKSLHRLIMLSSTYKQSSRYNPMAAAKDAEDRLLWRYPIHRMEGEAIRDSMLAISGRLNRTPGGPSFRPFNEVVDNAHIYTLIDRDDPELNRRTLYRMNVQSAKSPMLETLDCPDPASKAPRRNITTTPLQALELMNNSFVLRQADYFADLLQKRETSEAKQVVLAYRMAFGRTPTAAETDRAARLVQKAGMATLCWSLFNMSEFVTIR